MAPTIDDETGALYFGRGRAQLAVLPRYELEPASSSLRRAFDYYEQVGDIGRAVSVAACPIPLSLGLGNTAFPELIARGLKLVPPDSRETGQLLAQHGWYTGIVEADHGEAQRAFERALSIARTHGDVALERRTLANAAWVDVWHFHPQECLEKGTKAIELASQAGDDQTEINARRSIIWALMGSGDEREQIHAHTTAEFALADETSRQLVARLRGIRQRPDGRLRGRLGNGPPHERRRLHGRAARSSIARDAGPARVRARQLRRWVRRTSLGCRTQPWALRLDPSRSTLFMVGAIALTERIAGTDERLTSAATSAEALLSLPHLAPALAMVARSALAMIAVQRNEPEAAKEQYHAIEPHKRTGCFIIPFDVRSHTRTPSHHASVTIDTAITHYEDGLTFCERAGYRPEHAWTACDYADALLVRDRPGDREKAAASQKAALRTARELGMRPLIQRILDRQK